MPPTLQKNVCLYQILDHSLSEKYFKTSQTGDESGWTFCIVEMLSLLRSLCSLLPLLSVCLWPNTCLPPQLCQPSFFFSISVLMNLETKVECKRLEAASVSSFSTKLSPRYDCHRCRDSTPITCGQTTPASTDMLLFLGVLLWMKKDIVI